MKKLFLAFITCLFTLTAFAKDDVMVTRDGSFLEVKVIRISGSEVTFVNLKKKKLGELKAPTDYVYAILKEKGSNIFFDEEGNQTTSPAIEIDDDETYLFLNSGEIFPVFNLSIKKEELTYQLKDKKKAPYQTTSKNDVFLVKFSDGTTTLINNTYIEKRKKQQEEAAKLQQQAVAAATVNVSLPSTTTVAAPSTIALTASASTPSTNANVNVFSPAVDMLPQDIERKIIASAPYTLYRKGSVAEYAFEREGKPVRFMNGPYYIQQIVADAKIENGLYVAYVNQAFLNKDKEPMKGVSKDAQEYLFPTEIDTAGTFHLTHDISRDVLLVQKRQGYAMLMSSDMKAGDVLKCSTITDEAKSLLGGKVKATAAYSDFKIVGEEQVTTPAGTFQCLKLTGKSTEKNGALSTKYLYTWWIARGVGFVKYEIIPDTKKGRDSAPTIIYLNKLDLK